MYLLAGGKPSPGEKALLAIETNDKYNDEEMSELIPLHISPAHSACRLLRSTRGLPMLMLVWPHPFNTDRATTQDCARHWLCKGLAGSP